MVEAFVSIVVMGCVGWATVVDGAVVSIEAVCTAEVERTPFKMAFTSTRSWSMLACCWLCVARTLSPSRCCVAFTPAMLAPKRASAAPTLAAMVALHSCSVACRSAASPSKTASWLSTRTPSWSTAVVVFEILAPSAAMLALLAMTLAATTARDAF
jgi:hypothetical protein